MSSIHFSHIHCRLPDGRLLFHDLSFAVDCPRLALVGANGAGKSSLLRVLAGVVSAEGLAEASCETHGISQGIAWLRQDRFRDKGASENILESLGFARQFAALLRAEGGEAQAHDVELLEDCWDLRERLSNLFARAGLKLSPEEAEDRAAASLSGGERTRLALAGLLEERPGLLLLDEPGNHLDREGRRVLLELLDDPPCPILYVSHDRELLRRADRVLELRDGGLETHASVDAYLEAGERRREKSEREFHARRRELRREEERARLALQRQERRARVGARQGVESNMPKMSRDRNQQKAQQSHARLKAVHADRTAQAEERLDAARAARELRRSMRADLAANARKVAENHEPHGKLLIRVEDLNFRLPGGDCLWLRPLSETIRAGERIALRGDNGTGKSTLLRALARAAGDGANPGTETERGTEAPGPVLSGVLHTTENLRAPVLDQHVDLLDDSLSLLANLQKRAPGTPEHEHRIRLGRFLFYGDRALVRAGTLSGGERMRAGLAAALAGEAPPELLLLDEPQNNLDLESIRDLEASLQEFPGALLVVSHDEEFLKALGIQRRIILPPG